MSGDQALTRERPPKAQCPHIYNKGRMKSQKCPNMGTHEGGYCTRHHKISTNNSRVTSVITPRSGASSGASSAPEPQVPLRTASEAKIRSTRNGSATPSLHEKCDYIQLEVPREVTHSPYRAERVGVAPTGIRSDLKTPQQSTGSSTSKPESVPNKTQSINHGQFLFRRPKEAKKNIYSSFNDWNF